MCATVVEDLGQPMQRYFVIWLQSTLALLEGRFADAERLSNEALSIGLAADHPDAMVVFGTQAAVLGWQRGDTSSLVVPARAAPRGVPGPLGLAGRAGAGRGGRRTVGRGVGAARTRPWPISMPSTSVRSGPRRWSRSSEVCRILDRAGSRGADLRAARAVRRDAVRRQPQPFRDGPGQPGARRARHADGRLPDRGTSTSMTHSPRASGSAHRPTPPARRSTWLACSLRRRAPGDRERAQDTAGRGDRRWPSDSAWPGCCATSRNWIPDRRASPPSSGSSCPDDRRVARWARRTDRRRPLPVLRAQPTGDSVLGTENG